MDQKRILSKIGLSENESEIYLALLKLGAISAYEIAQKTGIYRPHVYDKLETLSKKGLVSFVQKGKKKIFSAASPDKLMEFLKEKEKEIHNNMDELSKNLDSFQKLLVNTEEDTKASVFVGIEGFRLCLKEVAEIAKKEVLIFGVDDSKYNESLPVFMPQYFKKLKSNKIQERVITQKKKFLFKNAVTKYRFLDSSQLNPVNTLIYENKVALVIWGTPINTIVIENERLAQTYREHFEYLWKIAHK